MPLSMMKQVRDGSKEYIYSQGTQRGDYGTDMGQREGQCHEERHHGGGHGGSGSGSSGGGSNGGLMITLQDFMSAVPQQGDHHEGGSSGGRSVPDALLARQFIPVRDPQPILVSYFGTSISSFI